MTQQASTWPRLRRALDRGNVLEALSAASELPHVGLAEALELVLLLRDREPGKFPRAALRWHARYCREAPDVEVTKAKAVLALLAMLPDERGAQAAEALADLIYRRGLEQACEALVRWARAAVPNSSD